MKSMKQVSGLEAILVAAVCLLVCVPKSHAGSFDGEVVSYKETKKFTAVYQGKPLLAWVGHEESKLKAAELQELASARANQLCNHFGYSVVSKFNLMPEAAPAYGYDKRHLPEDYDAIVEINRLGPNRNGGYLIKENQLVLLTTEEELTNGGPIKNELKTLTLVGLATIHMSRAFATITCAR